MLCSGVYRFARFFCLESGGDTGVTRLEWHGLQRRESRRFSVNVYGSVSSLAVSDNCSLNILLVDPEARRVLQRNLKLAQITLCPTYINVLEALSHNRTIAGYDLGRDTLLAFPDIPVLPATRSTCSELLAELCRKGSQDLPSAQRPQAASLRSEKRCLQSVQRTRAETYLENMTSSFDIMHAGLEAKIKRSLREKGITNSWKHTQEFLQPVYASRRHLLSHFCQGTNSGEG